MSIVLPLAAHADTVADFYRGKTVTMTVSAGAGNGVDTNARMVGRYLANYIPGKPTIIAKNMPGAGHVRAANYVYNDAPKDGTSLLATLGNIMTYQMMDGRGARYDTSKFLWLGSSEASNSMIFTWQTSGVKTMAEAMEKEVTMGATGVGSSTSVYPLLLNKLLGTKFKVVSGYQSDNEINIALERGEVQGRAGLFYNGLSHMHPDWLSEHKVNLLAQIGLEPEPEIPHVPLLLDLAKTQEQRQIMLLYIGGNTVGRIIATTPGAPPERVTALRRAFDATMRDADFLAEAKKKDIEISPRSGERIQQSIETYFATPVEVVAKAKALLGQ
jgi:tripartite-type tricarboxylate transporter receptor subunit TctC